MFLVKVVLKICSKFTGEHSCQSVTSIMLLCNFIEITLRYGCSPVNLLHTFRTSFTKTTSGWLLLKWEDDSPWIAKMFWISLVFLTKICSLYRDKSDSYYVEVIKSSDENVFNAFILKAAFLSSLENLPISCAKYCIQHKSCFKTLIGDFHDVRYQRSVSKPAKDRNLFAKEING